MNALRIRRQLESQVIDLPEIAALVGKHLEIIVLEEEDAESREMPTQPVFGSAKGQIWMAPDFNDTPEEFEEYM